MVSFCVQCTAAFYQPGAERIHKHCGECYREWAARKYGPKPLRRVATSPTSSRAASSGDTAEDCAVLRDLEVVLGTPDLPVLENTVNLPPPPPVSLVPEPTNISQLLEQLNTQATRPPASPPPALPPPPPTPPPPAPPRPTTTSVHPAPPMVHASTQTGLQAETCEFWASLNAFEAFLRFSASRQYLTNAFTSQIQRY